MKSDLYHLHQASTNIIVRVTEEVSEASLIS